MGFFRNKKDYIVTRNEVSSVEPEEIFFDAKLKRGIVGDDIDLAGSKLEVPLGMRNFLSAGIMILAVFALFLFYDIYLQIFSGDKFIFSAKNNSTRIISLKSPRGIIYDRYFNALVTNEPSFDVVGIPKDLPSQSIDDQLNRLSAIINISADELKEKIDKMEKMSIAPVVLKENLDKDSAFLLETQLVNFPGIKLEKNAVRNYKDGKTFSHILGYTAKISQKELKERKDYLPSDYIGKIGMEQFGENYLKGENGRIVIKLDARHNVLSEELESSPRVGHSVVLSIDGDLQRKAYDILEGIYQQSRSPAALVAVNPQNGEILALLSIPGYDNNLFSHGISTDDYKKLISEKSQPLLNRAIAGKYPPGSSIKPFIGVAALEESLITPEKQILSVGSISVGGNPETAFVFRDWKEGGHGLVDLSGAIAQSVNTYFYTIGGGYGDINGLGIEKIKKYLQMFGFGDALDSGIWGESSGFLPDSEWKIKRFGENWYIGDTYNASIGQGYISVTPLQLTTAVSAIANGGRLYRPKPMLKVVDTDGNTVEEFDSELIREGFVKEKNINAVREGMREAVTEGSARLLNSLPIKVAGKTGTAQFGNDGRTHAWFSGFAPYDNPQIVIVVLVEGGGEGSSMAVPVAKEIFQWMIDNKRI